LLLFINDIISWSSWMNSNLPGNKFALAM
jgi:hypothetical protein